MIIHKKENKADVLKQYFSNLVREEKGMHGHESMHELDPGDGCGMQSSIEERLQQKVLSKKAEKD